MSIYEVPLHSAAMKTRQVPGTPDLSAIIHQWIEVNPWRAVSLSLLLGGWFGYRWGVGS